MDGVIKAAGRAAPTQVARLYMRVSTEEQDLERQEAIIAAAKAAGFYLAGIYREKASGARVDRPELLRMINDLQPGEAVIAEKIDRLSRLPLAEAEKLVATIQAKGARLAIPGVVDLSDLANEAEGVAKIVLEAMQSMLLRLALQMAREDYE
ncbi:resolvase, partial [Corallococcus exiguus]|uniref:recombinase family protein n=2 Tax=Bacteria TaxID=2 RepID=UPI00116C8941